MRAAHPLPETKISTSQKTHAEDTKSFATEPARVLTVKFDGGHRPDPQATAAAAFISPTTYEKARLQGNSTSYRAEVCAAGLAHALAARVIAAQPADFDEVHLVGGNQAIAARDELTYGKSITDACLGWADSEMLLSALAAA